MATRPQSEVVRTSLGSLAWRLYPIQGTRQMERVRLLSGLRRPIGSMMRYSGRPRRMYRMQ